MALDFTLKYLIATSLKKNMMKSDILKTSDKNFEIDISINARSTSSIQIFIGIAFIFLKKLKLWIPVPKSPYFQFYDNRWINHESTRVIFLQNPFNKITPQNLLIKSEEGWLYIFFAQDNGYYKIFI